MASAPEPQGLPVLYLCGAGNPDGVRLALRLDQGGHRWSGIVLLDDDPVLHGSQHLGVTVQGPISMLADVEPGRGEVVNLVARTTRGRSRVRKRLEAFGHPFAGLVSPDVDLMGADVAPDAVIYPNATVGAESTIGLGCVVFMGAVVGHESVIGEGAVVASNAVLNARVRVGAEAYVGTNATILPELSVGAGATVGAGSVVVSDVADETSVMGVPARTLGPTPGLRATRSEVEGPGSDPHKVTGGADSAAREATVAEAWRAVLGNRPFDRDSNFFDVGGTSLLVLQLHEELRVRAGVDVSVVDLFRFPTIRRLGIHLAGPGDGSRSSPEHEATGHSLNGMRRLPLEEPGAVPELDELVTSVFRRVLGMPGLSPEDDFFVAGGDGRAAHDASVELQELTGLQLCFMHIVQFPTATRLAGACVGRSLAPVCPARSIINRRLARQTTHPEPWSSGLGV